MVGTASPAVQVFAQLCNYAARRLRMDAAAGTANVPAQQGSGCGGLNAAVVAVAGGEAPVTGDVLARRIAAQSSLSGLGLCGLAMDDGAVSGVRMHARRACPVHLVALVSS